MSVGVIADKATVIVRRDLLTAIRHRNAFLMTSAGAIAELATFYFLARAIGPNFRPEGVPYFPFLVVGTGFYTFLIMSINSFVSVVQEAQQNGTLEVMLATSTPASVLVALSALAAFMGNTVQLLFYVAGGFLLSGVPLHPNLAACAVVFVLSAIMVFAIGFAVAALQIALQKGSAVVWLIGSAAWLMTGPIFPVGTLPHGLCAISGLIPITHALEAMRLALLQDAGFRQLAPEFIVLGIFSAILLPVGLWMLSFAVHRARCEGTLSFY
jgi:ABC-2 type transport system permease protein